MLAIATGGAAGALLRYWTSTGIYGLLGRGFPYGTLVVNVLGSLVMGFLYVWLIDRLVVGPGMRAFLLSRWRPAICDPLHSRTRNARNNLKFHF